MITQSLIMSSSSAEFAEQNQPEGIEPGSSVYVAMPDYTRDKVQTLLVSRFSGQDGNAVNAQKSAENSLSEAECTALFDQLLPKLAMEKNCQGAPDIGVIRAALMKNPRVMRNLLRLPQQEKTKLVVTGFQLDQNGYVEFAQAQPHDIESVKNEVMIFNELTSDQKAVAIEKVIECDSAKQTIPYTDKQKQRLLDRFHNHCNAKRSVNDGLNFWQGLVYAAHFDGRLPSYEEDQTMAEKNPKLIEDAWTWRHNEKKSLLEIAESGFAPCGVRGGGLASRDQGDADNRFGDRGVRVAGLRVSLAA